LTNPETEKISTQYFLRLGAVLVILAAVYFGTHILGAKNTDQTASQISAGAPTQNLVLAATLPVAQSAFLIPANDAVLPLRNWKINPPELTAQSFYVIDITSGKILLAKEIEQIRPIASLSKLITALIILEKSHLEKEIAVSQSAIDAYGKMGNLALNEKISVKNLLYALLVESSNDAAIALAESLSDNNNQFSDFMNQKAASLGLKNTHFVEPSGLSPENVSTAKDLSVIMSEIINYPLLNEIMKTPEIDISSADGKYVHHLLNSDKLLVKYPEIIAGKTGYIDEAGNCMMVATHAPNQDIVITIILGSQDRTGETEQLLEWEKQGFLW